MSKFAIVSLALLCVVSLSVAENFLTMKAEVSDLLNLVELIKTNLNFFDNFSH